jgi:hypothetical protein
MVEKIQQYRGKNKINFQIIYDQNKKQYDKLKNILDVS